MRARVVLVTGASRGIGEAVAAAFAAQGDQVHILADGAAIFATAERLGVTGHQADITDAAALARVAGAIPPLNVLVNNAGFERMTPLQDPESMDLFRRVIEVNLIGTTLATQAFLPGMGMGARIINTASVWGRVAEPLFGAYVASKHGLIGLTKTWAKELGPRGITVNAVAPGWVRTEAALRSADLMAARSGQSREDVLAGVAASQALPGGVMEIADITGPYLFLASPWAANVTGQTLGVDRGEVPY